MTDYCLFTIEHPKARRVFIRGVADITQPVDDYDKIIGFQDGSEMSSAIPQNPFKQGEKEFDLFNELVNAIKTYFEDIGDELVFAKTVEKAKEWENCSYTDDYTLYFEKVII